MHDARAPIAAAHAAPSRFIPHVHEHAFTVNAPLTRCWRWLNTPETFTRGQLPGFRVEFVDPHGGPGDFRVGVLNAHVGPGLVAAGVLTRVDNPALAPRLTRELAYFYGSYVLSGRLIRPTRLVITAEAVTDANGASPTPRTRVLVRVDALVHRRWAWLATRGQRLFWPTFAWTMRHAVRGTAA